MALYVSFLVLTGPVYRKTLTITISARKSQRKAPIGENLVEDLLQQPSS
jgi:hypothetical protein